MKPSGWDYGLKHWDYRYAFKHSWMVAVQSEKELSGGSCPGKTNISFEPNLLDSPVTLDKIKGPDGYSINLKTDLYNHAHPCGSGYFTWTTWHDHIGHGGGYAEGDGKDGKLPRPDKLVTSVRAYYQHWLPDAAARGIIAFQGYWEDAEYPNGRSHLIEISTLSDNWGDADPFPSIVEEVDRDHLEYVHVDGEQIPPDVVSDMSEYHPHLVVGSEVQIQVDWLPLMDHLIGIDRLENPIPQGGDRWANTVSQSVFIGHELNNFSDDAAGVCDLWFRDFRVEEKD